MHQRQLSTELQIDSVPKVLKNLKGFSLVELLAVIAIVGVLATVGTPVILGMRAKSSVRADARDVHSAFRQAQTEAVKQNKITCLVIDGLNYTIHNDEDDEDISSKKLRPGSWFASNDFETDLPCFNARGLALITSIKTVNIENNAMAMQVALSPAGHVSSTFLALK